VASRPRVLNSVRAVVAVRGVAQQGWGWPHRIDSDGDGAPAGLTPWFDPAESREEGSKVWPAPLRGRGALAIQEWAAQCHGADTGLVAQFPTVAGMGSPWGVGGTAPGRDSQARSGAALLCQSIKCPYTRAGVGALVRKPRVRRTPLEVGGDPRARQTPLEGGGDPRARRTPLEGGASPRGRRTSFEGSLSPRARRTSLEGALCWAALVGRGGHHGVDRVVRIFCVRLEIGFAFCVFCRF
jgi:hypothetical protein